MAKNIVGQFTHAIAKEQADESPNQSPLAMAPGRSERPGPEERQMREDLANEKKALDKVVEQENKKSGIADAVEKQANQNRGSGGTDGAGGRSR